MRSTMQKQPEAIERIPELPHMIWSRIAPVTGWLSREEAELLWFLAGKVPSDGMIVEIGSYEGRSTLALALGALQHYAPAIYTIDPHTFPNIPERTTWSFPSFWKNLRSICATTLVHPLVMTSEEAFRIWQAPIDLLFLDGDHTEEMVLTDLRWLEHLRPGGSVVLNDAAGDGALCWPEVCEVLYAYLSTHPQFVKKGVILSSIWIQKQGTSRHRHWQTSHWTISDMRETLSAEHEQNGLATYIEQRVCALQKALAATEDAGQTKCLARELAEVRDLFQKGG